MSESEVTYGMEDDALTLLVVAWKLQAERLAAIGEIVAAEVLNRRQTFSAGGATCTFNNGRRTYDYEAGVWAAAEAGTVDPVVLEAAVQRNTQPKVNWRAVAVDVGLELGTTPFVQAEPSATFKLDRAGEVRAVTNLATTVRVSR